MKKEEKVAGERKVVNGRVVIRRKKEERTASAKRDAKKETTLNASEYEVSIKREISGFLYD